MSARHQGSPTAPAGARGQVENALSYLQCVLAAQRSRDSPEQVSWQQYDVLEALRLHGGMTPTAIGEFLGVSRPTTSKALRVLKDLGFVGQSSAEGDRREHTTSLTPLGETFLARAAVSRQVTAAAARSVLTDDEQRVFAELAERVAEALHVRLSGATHITPH